jgi:lipoprotein-anchoring transpeptidase ErfK/SrfK
VEEFSLRHLYLSLFLIGATAVGADIRAAAAPGKTSPDPNILQLQVTLDRLGFSPGVIDGRSGFTLSLAISGFQKANNLTPTGKLDRKTTEALAKLAAAPAVTAIKLTTADLAGPFVGPLPREEAEQAALPALGYANPLEMLAERYHTKAETIIALNPPNTKTLAGTVIKVPNVITSAHDYPPAMPIAYRQTLTSLHVPSGQPQADHLTVSKSKRSLSVFDAAGKLIAQFPVTTGSEHDPLPIGRWKITGASYNPQFHYNPKLFWDASKADRQAMIQPGPNNPVGIIWLDISKPHYGIHGTPEPQNIGRSESHGCIRMTNWDAGRLSLMVKPGTPMIFQR